MVTKFEAHEALTEKWQSTPEVAGRIERRAKSARMHEVQVWQVLETLADRGLAERYRAGALTYWRRVRCPPDRAGPPSPRGQDRRRGP